MSNSTQFLSRIGGILALNIFVGIGAYFVALQFNDGKLDSAEYGAIFLAMALPNLLIGGVLRLFRPDIGRYFLRTAAVWLLIGCGLIFTN
ncbi:MAG: hypothetical protein IT259_07820 [Saprospiraceae bacterium]|nr:hypothetical protein [Saprospiraceae bacterium]